MKILHIPTGTLVRYSKETAAYFPTLYSETFPTYLMPNIRTDIAEEEWLEIKNANKVVFCGFRDEKTSDDAINTNHKLKLYDDKAIFMEFELIP